MVLVGVSVVLGLCFVIVFGRPWRSDNPAMAWLQWALAAVALAFDAMVMVSLFRVAVPMWAVALILLAQDGVFAWRLAKLARTRRPDATADS